MSAAVTKTLTFHVLTCYCCGVAFALENGFDDRRRADGQSFYCPNGHAQAYCESEVDKLRKKLQAEEAEKERLRKIATQEREAANHYRADRDAARRSVSAQKGIVTRMKNAAAKGRCPCCNQYFSNLRAHMDTKHPDYAETEEPEV